MKFRRYLIFAALSALLASCSGHREMIRTVEYSFADSTAYAVVALKVDVPEGDSDIECAIRSSLTDILEDDLQKHCDNFEEISIDRFKGDSDDLESMVSYYGKSLSTFANFLSRRDDMQRRQFVESSSEYDQAEKDEILQSPFAWAYDISLEQIDQTDRYIVFSSCDYVYLGGAHGGVSGLGTFTFSKKDGSIVSSFLKPSSEAALQPALKRGLVEYFAENGETVTEDNLAEYLFIEDGIIPLPQYQPYPSDAGLVFVYQQYEIGPYALGMPSFLIPYSELRPYLTDKAKDILKK